MKSIPLFFIFLFSSLMQASGGEPNFITFKSCGKMVEVSLVRPAVQYVLKKSRSDVVKASIPLEVETQPHISVEDYNFDGCRDFSIWYIDEGMGRDTIHRIFIKKKDSFEEIHPQCGDEFMNLRVDKKKKILRSTVYIDNQASLCFTKVGEDKNSNRGIASKNSDK